MRRAVPVFVLTVVVSLGINADARQRTAPSARDAQSAAAPASAAPRPAASHSAAPATLSISAQNELVGKYCATCHSARAKAGGLLLAGYDSAKALENGELTEKIIRKLRARMMPPAGA